MKFLYDAKDGKVYQKESPPFTSMDVRELLVVNGDGKEEFVVPKNIGVLYDDKNIQEILEELEYETREGDQYILRADVQAPYDGCFWEPNYFLLNYHEVGGEDGDYGWYLYPLYVSGKEFKRTAKWAEPTENGERMRLEVFLAFLVDKTYPDYKDLELYVVDAQVYKHIACHFWESLCSETYGYEANPNHTHTIYGVEFEFNYKCPQCGKLRSDPPRMTGYQGNGGVGIEVTDVVCGECYDNNSCSECGEYCDPDTTDKYCKGYYVEEHGLLCYHHAQEHWSKCRGCGEKVEEIFAADYCAECAKDVLENGVCECLDCGESKFNQDRPKQCNKCYERMISK